MNEQNAAPLDLSKLAPVELPVETLEIKLKGDVTIDESGNKIQRVQRISIHPLCGRGVIAWGNNAKNNPNDVTFEERACLTALIYGADISEEDAIRLMDCDRTTANAISLAVWVATTRFYKAKREEAETAEKNSGTAGTNTGN